MASIDERETHILFDYESKRVKIYTTEKGVYSALRKRLGTKRYRDVKKTPDSPGELMYCTESTAEGTYVLNLPFSFCRYPALIAKLLDEDRERGTFPSAS